MQLQLDRFATPLGDLLLVFDDEGLRALDFADFEPRMHRLLRLHYGAVTLINAPAPASITGPLTAYFAGDAAALDSIAVATGGTDFQRKVWAALRTIPAGETWSYGALANRIGSPGASRAVGMANGSNPIGIVVPCHRVIGANGTLTGYAGGVERKRWLLSHEGAMADNRLI
jgi:O-6-methylguanine DNA methyltransferase